MIFRPLSRVTAALLGAALLFTAVPLTACAASTTPTANPQVVDLPRFMGAWHVIAHVPYFGERGDVASVDEYALTAPGRIAVTYHYQRGFSQPRLTIGALARVKRGSGNRDWTTWFFGVIPTQYRILEVAPDYAWALI